MGNGKVSFLDDWDQEEPLSRLVQGRLMLARSRRDINDDGWGRFPSLLGRANFTTSIARAEPHSYRQTVPSKLKSKMDELWKKYTLHTESITKRARDWKLDGW